MVKSFTMGQQGRCKLVRRFVICGMEWVGFGFWSTPSMAWLNEGNVGLVFDGAV